MSEGAGNMLDLKDGGRCIGGIDAVEFFEQLAAGEGIDTDIKTEEFCNEYTWALNRLRNEVRKSMPIKPRIVKALSKGHRDFYSCGACGFPFSESDLPIYRFCPNCGRAVDKRE